MIQYRLDEQPAITSQWSYDDTNAETADAGEVLPLIAKMYSAKRIFLRAKSYRYKDIDLLFRLDGIDRILDRIRVDCDPEAENPPEAIATPPSTSVPASNYVLDSSGNVTELRNLSSIEDCAKDEGTIRIVDRKFRDSVIVTEITSEDSKGARSVINIDLDVDSMSQVDKGYVVRGLQLLTKPGRTAHVTTSLCGAAGRFEYLTGIR